MKIVTVDQMQELERRSQEVGVSTDTLMEKAGLAVAQKVRHTLGHLVGVPILVLVGPGNNGGDGLVTARHLHSWGAQVRVYLCARRNEDDPKLDLVLKQGAKVIEVSNDRGMVQLEEHLASSHMVIDAVLGTGTARPIKGELKEIFVRLGRARENTSQTRLLALDLPSGLNADNGATDPICVGADITVTLGNPKVGLFSFPGAEKVGKLEVVDIGIPPGLDNQVRLDLMTPQWAEETLPRRPSHAHKGSFGKALVVVGSRNYIGAAYLACAAATRVGAGLVTLATPQSLQPPLASKLTEVTHIPLPELDPYPGAVSAEAIPMVGENLPNYEALLIGCGLGQAPTTEAFVEKIILSGLELPPTILDADALNILARRPQWWKEVKGRAILTPHPGEMARLTSDTVRDIEGKRVEQARKAAKQWNQVVVLKGAYTVVASPDDWAMVSPFANPGLASAGTGDVLAGAIVGLLAQGVAPFDAACLGVYLHGAAGEEVRRDMGDTGMVAGDLLPVLPRVIKGLREKQNRSP